MRFTLAPTDIRAILKLKYKYVEVKMLQNEELIGFYVLTTFKPYADRSRAKVCVTSTTHCPRVKCQDRCC